MNRYYMLCLLMLSLGAMEEKLPPKKLPLKESRYSKSSGALTRLKTPRDERPLKKLFHTLGFSLDNGTLTARTPCEEINEKAGQHLEALRILAGQQPTGNFEENLLQLCKILKKSAAQFADLSGENDDYLNGLRSTLRKKKREYYGPRWCAEAQEMLNACPAPNQTTTIPAALSEYEKIIRALVLLRKSKNYRYKEATALIQSAEKKKKEWETLLLEHPDCQEIQAYTNDGTQALNAAQEASAQEAVPHAEKAAHAFLQAYYLSKKDDHLNSAGNALDLARKKLRAMGAHTPTSLQQLQTQYLYIKDQHTSSHTKTEEQPLIPSRGHRASRKTEKRNSPSLELLQSSFAQGLIRLGLPMPAEILNPCKPNEPNHNSQQHYFAFWYRAFASVLSELLDQPQSSDPQILNDRAFPVMRHLIQRAQATIDSGSLMGCEVSRVNQELDALHKEITQQEQTLYAPYYYQQGLSASISAESLMHEKDVPHILERISYLLIARHRMLCAQEHGHQEAANILTSLNEQLKNLQSSPPPDLATFVKTLDQQRDSLDATLQKWRATKNTGKKLASPPATLQDMQKSFEDITTELLRLANQYPSDGLLETIGQALHAWNEIEIARNQQDPSHALRMNGQWSSYSTLKERFAQQKTKNQQ